MIDVGIIGLGRSGWDIHAAAIRLIPESFRIVAVSDPDAGRCGEARAATGAAIHPTAEGLIADPRVGLVVVATPSHLHAGQAIGAMRAGKDVLCEKPMSASAADAQAMVDAAQVTGRSLAVFHNMRYDPAFLKVCEVIASGALGRIVMIRIASTAFARRWDWQTLQRFGGGSMGNAGAHVLDLALQLFGPSMPHVSASFDRTLTLGDAEDHVKVVLSAVGAPTIDLEVSSACAYPLPTWQVYGTLGGLVGSPAELRWKSIDPKRQVERTLDDRPFVADRAYARDELVWEAERMWRVSEEAPQRRDINVAYYRALAAAMSAGRPAPVVGAEVLRVMQVTEMCRKAAAAVSR